MKLDTYIRSVQQILLEIQDYVDYLLENKHAPAFEPAFYDALAMQEDMQSWLVKLQSVQQELNSSTQDVEEEGIAMRPLTVHDGNDIKSIDAFLESGIKQRLLNRQQNGVMSASYGYFLSPRTAGNLAYKKLTGLLLEPQAPAAEYFKLLLPDYIITGVYDPHHGQVDQAYSYNDATYSEVLHTAKKGPVISMPHLLLRRISTLLAIFFLDSVQIATLTIKAQSKFYKNQLIPLTNLEKAIVYIYNTSRGNNAFNSASSLFLSNLQNWVQASVKGVPSFIEILSFSKEVFRKGDYVHSKEAAENLLKYWSLLTEAQQQQFNGWCCTNYEGCFPDYIDLLRQILIYKTWKNFSGVVDYFHDIVMIAAPLSTEGRAHNICQLKLGAVASKNYHNYLFGNIIELHKYLYKIADSRRKQNYSDEEITKINEVVQVLSLARPEDHGISPVAIRNADEIAHALIQLPREQHLAFLDAIMINIHASLSDAVDFLKLLQPLPIEDVLPVCEKLRSFLRVALFLNEKIWLGARDIKYNQFCAFTTLAKTLPADKLKIVCGVLINDMPTIISSYTHFNILMHDLTAPNRLVIYEVAKLWGMIPSTGVDLYLMSQHLTIEVSHSLYTECKKNDMANVIAMINGTNNKNAYDNYEGLMHSLYYDAGERSDIISALNAIIENRLLPIYDALREGQSGIMKTRLKAPLRRMTNKKERVEYLLKYISHHAESRTALAWYYACRLSLCGEALFKDVMQRVEHSHLSTFVRYLADTLVEYTTIQRTPMSDTNTDYNEVDPQVKAVRSELAKIKSVAFTH